MSARPWFIENSNETETDADKATSAASWNQKNLFFHNFLVKMNNAGLCLVVPGADSIQTWNLSALHPRAIKECQILGDSASVTVSQCHTVTLHNWRKNCDTAHLKVQLAHNSQPHHMCTDNTLLSDKNWPPFCGFITIHHKGSPQKKPWKIWDHWPKLVEPSTHPSTS